MKRTLLLLAFVIISMASFAEETWLTARAVAFKNEYQSEFPKWEACNIPISIDFDRKRIVVESKETQIIDWVSLEENTATDGYTRFYESMATDKNYKAIKIQIWYQSTQMVIRVLYSDYQYQYRIPKTN